MRHHFANLHLFSLLLRWIPLIAAFWWLGYTKAGKTFKKNRGGTFWTVVLSVAFAGFIIWSVGTLANWMHEAQSPTEVSTDGTP